MTRRALLPFAALALMAFSSCSSDDEDGADTTEQAADDTSTDDTSSDTTGDTSSDTFAPETTPEVCEPLQVISDYDNQSAELIATAQEFEVLRDFLVDSAPDVLGAYDEVAELEPTLAEDAATLAEITEATLDAAGEASSMPELASVLLNNPNVEEAGQAGERLDVFAERECGFSTGSN